MWYEIYFSDKSYCQISTRLNETEDDFIDRMRKEYQAIKIVRALDGVLVYEKLVQD